MAAAAARVGPVASQSRAAIVQVRAQPTRRACRSIVACRASDFEDAAPAAAQHPEVPAELCEETLQFNATHLGVLAQRIEQIRKEQALHMLQHHYTPTTLHEAVEAALESRPGMEEGIRPLAAWHEAQWAELKKKVHE